jgi:5-methylcytosine-specific restriction endonuclease McrA
MPNAPRQHRASNPTLRPRDNRQFSAAERGYNWQWTKDKPALLTEMILAESDPFCRYCRKVAENLILDHAIPPARKGPVGSAAYEQWMQDRRYLIPACGRCNTQKGQVLPDELKKRHPEMYQRMVAVLAKRGVKL